MKNILIIIFFLGLTNELSAQFIEKISKRVENKVNQRVNKKIDKTIDKGLDKIEGKIEQPRNANNSSPVISSNFDFLPGDELIFFDDFSQSSIGDFPARWNTNSSGQIVTISSLNGKWLLIPDNTLTFPAMKGRLPENFTIEFDLFYPANTTRPPITFGFTEVSNPAKDPIKGKGIFYFRIPPKGAGLENIGYTTSLYSGREITTEWPANQRAGQLIHMSLAIHGQRIRMYADTEKMFDLPRAFDANSFRNNFFFRSAELIPKPNDGFYISNVRIAKISKDISTFLLDEGKYITSGIHFDIGSDKIKTHSYYLLNEIGETMKKNPSVKFDVIGHTDADGSVSLNQKLSLQRAEAVRNYLIKNCNLSPNILLAIGKGATSPISTNNTVEGKSQNRRVEFVKK